MNSFYQNYIYGQVSERLTWRIDFLYVMKLSNIKRSKAVKVIEKVSANYVLKYDFKMFKFNMVYTTWLA
jgi:hypothetical protein